MKYARCPNCNGRLGIPNKKRGRPVNCPKCDTEFVAPDHLDNQSSSNTPTPEANTQPAARTKPSIRAFPIPTGISPATPDSAATSPGIELTPPKKRTPVDLTPPRPAADPMMPPTAKRAETSIKTKQSNSPLDPPKSLTPDPVPRLSQPPLPVASIIEPGGTADIVDATVVEKPAAKPDKPKRSVATIVKTESIQPSLTKDGKLPTLRLTDEFEVMPKEETKSNPVLLVTVVSVSLLSSLLMLLMLGGDSNQHKERVEKTRQQIRVFYEVRPDQEIKSYQTELRQAQLANSRGDYRTEIRAYEMVMARFRDENFDQYSGLTGSQNSDRELEKWVSILLNEAKRNAKR